MLGEYCSSYMLIDVRRFFYACMAQSLNQE